MGTGTTSTPRLDSRSSSCSPSRPPAGRTARARMPLATRARATFTPFPPGCTRAAVARTTSPRSREGISRVRSTEGFAVRVTITSSAARDTAVMVRGSRPASRLDDHLQSLAFRHRVDRLMDPIQGQSVSDQVSNRNRPARDQLERLPVVVGGGPVRPQDEELLVVDEVGVEPDDRVVPRQPPEEGDATAARRHLQGLLLGLARAGGGHDDVSTTTIRQLANRIDGILLRAVDHRIGLGASCHVQAPSIDVRKDDGRRTTGPGQANVEATDRPGTEDDDDVSFTHVGDLLTVQDASERFRETRFLERDVLGDPIDSVAVEHPARDAHELSEATVVLVAHGLQVLADCLLPLPAVIADTARDGRDDLDPVSRGPALDSRAHLGDLTGDLVAED